MKTYNPFKFKKDTIIKAEKAIKMIFEEKEFKYKK